MGETIKIQKLISEYNRDEYECIEKLCADYRNKRKINNRLLVGEPAIDLADNMFKLAKQRSEYIRSHLKVDDSLDDYTEEQKQSEEKCFDTIEIYYQMLILTCLLQYEYHPHQVAYHLGNMADEVIVKSRNLKKGSDILIAQKIDEYWRIILKEVSSKGVLFNGINPLRFGFAKFLGWNHFYPDNLII